ncbi:MAG: efflux RND transporter periplasmic adaptor subunit [Bacteroidetes bacterium]|nr:MAG: efflux RND transporter periplasmic adaptor subunit [Bacteroidota bacterium]
MTMVKCLHVYLLVAGCLFLASCGNKEKPAVEAISEFPVLELKAVDTTLENDYVAQIQAVKNVEIRSPGSGFIKQIFVDEGQFVAQGQLLVQLNDERYRNELEKSQALVGSAVAEMDAADVEVRRVKILADKNVISKVELELAEAKHKIAKAKLSEAKANESNARLMLSYAAVRAPYSGVINRIPLKLGSLVNEGTLLTTLSDLQTMFAYFNLSEREYLQYMDNKKKDSAQYSGTVNLMTADGKRFSATGKIETMETEIDAATGSLAFRARFQNVGNLLKHGSTGKVLLTSRTEGVVVLPQKSVFEIQDKNYVYVVDKNNKVTIRNVLPGARLGNAYLVRNGLTAGERILFEGNQTIKEGQIIKPKNITWDGL